jgi:glucan phosphoethanolaminetransferase (alkaline phosphatase superfamily)
MISTFVGEGALAIATQTASCRIATQVSLAQLLHNQPSALMYLPISFNVSGV